LIHGDQEQLRQVFLNLFLNAIDSIAQGGILSIETKLLEADKICVIVSDTGHGISQENLKNLFTPFFSTKKEGIGLGLVIVQEIIKNHKGNISVESEIGKGTKFIIELNIYSRNKSENYG